MCTKDVFAYILYGRYVLYALDAHYTLYNQYTIYTYYGLFKTLIHISVLKQISRKQIKRIESENDFIRLAFTLLMS